MGSLTLSPLTTSSSSSSSSSAKHWSFPMFLKVKTSFISLSMISICGVVATICHNHLRRWWIGRKRFAIRQSPRPDLCVMVANILVFRQSAKQRVSALYCSLFAEELDWRPLSSSPSPPYSTSLSSWPTSFGGTRGRYISQLLKLAQIAPQVPTHM